MKRYKIVTSRNINAWLASKTVEHCDIYGEQDGSFVVTTTAELATDDFATVEEII